jgi:hypothetical protein
LLFVISAQAGQIPSRSLGDFDMLYGGNPDFSKTVVDTHYLIGPWGSGAQFNGQFEDQEGNPAWNGWTHLDMTQPGLHWQVSTYYADNLAGHGPGNKAAWCGSLSYVACTETDVDGGYGNSWNELLEWRATVDPGLPTAVHFTAHANTDSEPGYDYTEIAHLGAEGPVILAAYDGTNDNLFLDFSFTLYPADYQGENQDEVVLQVRFSSDGAWSDADCLFYGHGALQIDDISVTLDQDGVETSSFTDFQDDTFGDWSPGQVQGAGDFSQLWTNLQDIDPCRSNFTTQVAFIDDGLIVPGVGPSYCINWCYGPNGYIVNTTGGAAAPDGHLHNQIESPVIPWPEGNYAGAVLDFSVFRHEDLSADAPGIFYNWAVRSTTSEDPQDIQNAGWQDRTFVYYGGPDYHRSHQVVSDLLQPGRRFVQASAVLYEIGYVWGWIGNDGYPAPYYDNFRFYCYPYHGPGMTAREIDLANDSFPAIGEVDLNNLGNNSVRFDMARNISLNDDLVNIPGDSIVINLAPLREGSELVGEPELHWRLKKNLIFDQWRTSEFGTAVSGVSPGFPASNNGNIQPDRWAFDLPDSNFLFPGDVLHYFIKAADDDGVEVQSATMPADTTGFSEFRQALSYDSSYTVRALPTVFEDPGNPGLLRTPEVLFWNDFANRGGENEWHGALENLGFRIGISYDCYYTNGPSSGVGNGLGGRATPYSLLGYGTLLYSCGDLSTFTMSNGDYNNDPSNDLQVLDSWLRLGGKNMFLTGDNLVFDLAINAGPDGGPFVEDWLGVDIHSFDVRYLIGNQATPLVRTVAGNGILFSATDWISYGGCNGINTFDAVVADTEAGAICLAEFTDPAGTIGQYPFSAATFFHETVNDARVISLPYDLMYVYTNPDQEKAPASLPDRVLLLRDVLGCFGIDGYPAYTVPVPAAAAFAVKSYPNPFNPRVKIEYTVPGPAHLSLKVFNLRGQLVRTLLDQRVESGGFVMWDGADDQGAASASGVYFYEARTGGEVKVSKLTLIR